jgi:hypothetical protein
MGMSSDSSVLPSKSRRGSGARATIVLISLAFTLLAIAPLGSANAVTSSPWTKTTPYPTTSSGAVCVTSSGYIYCVDNGGATYYGKLYTYGVGKWTQTTSYPLDISSESCVASGGYVYCVSGFCNSIQNPGCSAHPEAPTTKDYYAQLSSSGIGPWTQTSSIIEGGLALSCAADSSYLYCIGGFQTVGADPSAHDYYATISPSGIGPWSNTTAYPVVIQSQTCTTSESNIYCVGGGTGNGNEVVDSTYYAPVSSLGVGAWVKSPNYSTNIFDSQCLTSSSDIYCVGGSVAGSGTSAPTVSYSPLSATGGIGPWKETANYPDVYLSSCVTSNAYIYCVGTQTAVYYVAMSSLSTSNLTVASETTTGTPLTGYYTVLFQDGKIVAAGDTTATFTLTSGQSYVIQADSYGNCIFQHWSNGQTTASMSISITSNTEIKAVYGCTTSSDSSFTVSSQGQNGVWMFGYYAILESGGKVVGTGYTTQTFATNAGQSYTIQVANYGSCIFSHWSDGNTNNPREFPGARGAIGFTAVYSCA